MYTVLIGFLLGVVIGLIIDARDTDDLFPKWVTIGFTGVIVSVCFFFLLAFSLNLKIAN